MKILLITNIPTPYRNAFYNVLGQCLIDSGDGLKVLFCSKNEPNRHWKIDLDQMLFEYEFMPGVHFNLRKIFVHFNPCVIRKTREFNPDIILYSGAWNMLTVIYSLLHSRLFRKRWKTLFWSEGHEGSVLYPTGIVPKIRLWILNKFDGFAVPNQRSKNYLLNYLNVSLKPIILLPNTVNGDFYSKPHSWSESDNTRVKNQYGISPGKRICIQVSQIESRKGIMELIHYWHALSSDVKDHFVLFLVGEGSLRADAQSYCKEHELNDVVLTGNKTAYEVKELLFASDIFILLTKNDPNPLTLIEASFAGLTIITTKFAGNSSEIIHQDINGRVMDDISYNSFIEAFKKVKEISRNPTAHEFSFKNASLNFNIKQVAEQFTCQVRKFLTDPGLY